MKLLFKTTDEKKAHEYEAMAEKKYGMWNIYRFQYRSNDGNFYYEILLND